METTSEDSTNVKELLSKELPSIEESRSFFASLELEECSNEEYVFEWNSVVATRFPEAILVLMQLYLHLISLTS